MAITLLKQLLSRISTTPCCQVQSYFSLHLTFLAVSLNNRIKYSWLFPNSWNTFFSLFAPMTPHSLFAPIALCDLSQFLLLAQMLLHYLITKCWNTWGLVTNLSFSLYLHSVHKPSNMTLNSTHIPMTIKFLFLLQNCFLGSRFISCLHKTSTWVFSRGTNHFKKKDFIPTPTKHPSSSSSVPPSFSYLNQNFWSHLVSLFPLCPMSNLSVNITLLK